MNRGLWTYDIETMSECFTYTGFNVDTNEVVQYVIHETMNDIAELLTHLEECKGQISFNGIGFDYPVLHRIMDRRQLYVWMTSEEIISEIYQHAQDIIESQNSLDFSERYKHIINEEDMFIPQLDLFRLHHFDNRAKRTSLKDVEIGIGFHLVQDLPIHHSAPIAADQIDQILEYNLNDVKATHALYLRSGEMIEMRRDISNLFDINCMNYSNSKLGEKIMLKLYCEATGKSERVVSKLRTTRGKMKGSDIVFPYINFQEPVFTALLEKIKDQKFTLTKEEDKTFSYKIPYKGLYYIYGIGGIHACNYSGIYESDSDIMIIDADVASLYPSIAIVNNLYPEHLGSQFPTIYKEKIVDVRLKAKKEGKKTISDGLKEAANSVYGKSNSEHSFLYDPLYTLRTTINGQLMLTMLAEKLHVVIPELKMLQINTDGLTVMIPRYRKAEYDAVCKAWEDWTNLVLEFVEYNKMIIRDVNNYVAIDIKGKVKHKGCFEISRALHKNNSFRIIPIALSEYYVNGTPIKYTIRNHTNILDFCGRYKATRGWKAVTAEIGYTEDGTSTLKEEFHQKTNRYFISKKGKSLFKRHEDGRKISVEKGETVTVFNKFEEKPFPQYAVDYDYYYRAAMKIVNAVSQGQTCIS